MEFQLIRGKFKLWCDLKHPDNELIQLFNPEEDGVFHSNIFLVKRFKDETEEIKFNQIDNWLIRCNWWTLLEIAIIINPHVLKYNGKDAPEKLKFKYRRILAGNFCARYHPVLFLSCEPRLKKDLELAYQSKCKLTTLWLNRYKAHISFVAAIITIFSIFAL